MKFLIIEQDLKVSGTSQGVISRSFLAKLRMSYPDAVIDVLYLKSAPDDDQLHLLPVDHIETHLLDLRIPFFTKLVNRFYWRIFHVSLNERYIHKVYASYIRKADYNKYDHIMIRSAGLEHEIILACEGLPLLKKSIVNFHDPYPVFWYSGTKTTLTNIELFRMKQMYKVVCQAKTCSSSAFYMAQDLQNLYGSQKKFYTLPHQFSEKVFDFTDNSHVLPKSKKISIAYHGAIQFGRNADNLLDAYCELLDESTLYRENSEFRLRIKGPDNRRLSEKYRHVSNIQVLDCLNFSNSSNEQMHQADINIILENGPYYCNILVGKAPFLAAIRKPLLCISPKKSELRNIIADQKYVADMNSKDEIKSRLRLLMDQVVNDSRPVDPFGDFFGDENFTILLNRILADKGNAIK